MIDKEELIRDLGWVDPFEVSPEEVTTIVDALKKQIPNKVYEGKIKEQMGFYCPSCHNELIQDDEWEYCMFCGQALDWSKNDIQ